MKIGIIHSDGTIIDLLTLVVENEGFEVKGLNLKDFEGVKDLVAPINDFLTTEDPSIVLFDSGNPVKYQENINLFRKVKENNPRNTERVFVPVILDCEEKKKIIETGEGQGIKFNYVCNAGNTEEIGGLIRTIEADVNKIVEDKEASSSPECCCKRGKEREP